MPVNHSLSPGQIVLCDFRGLELPEMVKSGRPVVVLTPSSTGLVTVVGCSTTKPDPVTEVHYRIPPKSMPNVGMFRNKETWVKGDMVYRFAHHRLDMIRLDVRDGNGKRQYYLDRLGRDQMKSIFTCVLHGLRLPQLTHHL